MNILQVNKYFYIKGGAESVFFDTAHLLENNGHRLSYFSMDCRNNYTTDFQRFFVKEIDYDLPFSVNSFALALKLLYSKESREKLEKLVQYERPDVAHLHNIYHQISPSILHTLRNHRIPVIMTLHDYKIVCAAHSLLSSNKVCTKCRYGRHFNCLFNKCIKSSYLKSALGSLEMYLHHHFLHIFELVDVFISPSKFLINVAKEMGFTREIAYLPNFIDLERVGSAVVIPGKIVTYLGRLSHEKGLFTLLEAARSLPDITFQLIGDGPLRKVMEERALADKLINVKFKGFLIGDDLRKALESSACFILCSQCFENNPRSLIEGFALSKPAIGSRIGGIPELVTDNVTGVTFEPGNSFDLQGKIRYLLDRPDEIVRMGKNARAFVENELNPKKHYEQLIKIYERAVEKSKSRN